MNKLLDKRETEDSEMSKNERKANKKYWIRNRKQVINKSNDILAEKIKLKRSCDNSDYLMTELN
jgi:hypothetical protein